ncbi:hypothetical protein IJM86_08530 [bacterium]|nr:hypothetical protein [bacterium]
MEYAPSEFNDHEEQINHLENSLSNLLISTPTDSEKKLLKEISSLLDKVKDCKNINLSLFYHLISKILHQWDFAAMNCIYGDNKCSFKEFLIKELTLIIEKDDRRLSRDLPDILQQLSHL